MGRMLFSTLALASIFLAAANAKADELKYIAHADEALAAFMGLPNAAERSIDIATFIFEPCHPSGQLMLETLSRKAKAGVRVRVLLDGLTQSKAQVKNLSDYFAKNGMELKFYNLDAIFNYSECI